jgi:hypothetical protein
MKLRLLSIKLNLGSKNWRQFRILKGCFCEEAQGNFKVRCSGVKAVKESESTAIRITSSKSIIKQKFSRFLSSNKANFCPKHSHPSKKIKRISKEF